MYQNIYACIEICTPNRNYYQVVKKFTNKEHNAKDIREWLGIDDVSHIYKSIKAVRHSAYKDPISNKKLIWIDPDSRIDLINKPTKRFHDIVENNATSFVNHEGIVAVNTVEDGCVLFGFSDEIDKTLKNNEKNINKLKTIHTNSIKKTNKDLTVFQSVLNEQLRIINNLLYPISDKINLVSTVFLVQGFSLIILLILLARSF